MADLDRTTGHTGRIGRGAFVAVVGPSGSGKDTLINHARRNFRGDGRIIFARRVITRPTDAASEDHETLDEAAFAEAEKAGVFCIAWSAHGLRYGLPKSVERHVAGGGVAVANVSRAVIPALRERFVHVAVAAVTAPLDVLAQRLAARGRESGTEAAARLARTAPCSIHAEGATVIDNSGAPEIAGERLVALLDEMLARVAGD